MSKIKKAALAVVFILTIAILIPWTSNHTDTVEGTLQIGSTRSGVSNETGISTEAHPKTVPEQYETVPEPRQKSSSALPAIERVSIGSDMERVHDLVMKGGTDQAARILSELYENVDSLNKNDKIALLELYAKLLMELGANVEAIDILEQLLGMPEIPRENKLSAEKALAESLITQGEWVQSASLLENWLTESGIRDSGILFMLTKAYYQQKLWNKAIPSLIEHIDLLINEGEEIPSDKLALLNVMTLETEDWDSAAWITQVMISQFNRISDWERLIAIHTLRGDDHAIEQVFLDAETAGVLDELESSLGKR